jgi:lysozyme
MHSFYLDAIRNFEGYTPQASWDYAQFSNGYGTRAKFAGEVIDRTEAERRFQAEVSAARSIVERAAPHMDEGTKAALTSLTYNAGTAWIESGLGDAVRRGDLDAVRDIFKQYNKAGGEVLPGLVNRRAQEALWIGNPGALPSGGAFTVAAASGEAAPLPPVIVDADASVRELQEMISTRQAPVEGSSARGSSPLFERLPKAERTEHGATLANNALAALVDADLKGAEAADIVRLAQLGRGSELARSDKDRQDSETRRV